MGVFKQFGLLLKQNFIERKRRWGTSLLQIGWPIVLLVVIVTIRNMYPVEDVKECKYEPRAMPSSGLLPLMQSYVCNMNATPSCINDQDPEVLAQSRLRTSALKSIEDTLKSSQSLFTQLSVGVEKAAPALQQISITLEETPEIEEFLNITGGLLTRDLFKDAEALKNSLVKSFGIDDNLVDTILNSTVNLTQGAQIIQDLNSELCTDNDTSYLSKYIVLPATSSVSLSALNKALCQLDTSTKAQILDLLQQQLNVPAVISLAKKMLTVLTPDAGVIVSDIQEMLTIVSKLSSFEGLARELPNIKNALDFTMQALEFVKQVTASMPVSPEIIGELLEKFDPLITRITGNSQVWQDIKRGIWYLNKAISWVSNTLEKLPDMKISLGNLYTDGGQTILDLFNSTLTDSEYLLDVLGQSSIQLTKMMQWQNSIISSNNETGCWAVESFFHIFDYPDNVDMTRLNEVINSTVLLYCQLDAQAFLNELSSKTNFATLLEEFAKYSNSTIGDGSLDWTSIVQTGWDLVDLIVRLQEYFEKYATLIERLINVDPTQIFNMFQNPLAGMANGSMSTTQIVYQSIATGLEFAESILRNTPIWPYIRSQLIIQNLFSELAVDTFNLSIEAIKTADEYFSHNEVEKFVAVFIDMDAATQELLATGLMSPRNVRAMLRNSSEFASQLCNNLSGVLGVTLNSTVEQDLHSVLCNSQTFMIPQGLPDHMTRIGAEIQDKIDKVVEAFTNPASLETAGYDSFASLSAQLMTQQSINEMLADVIMNTRLYNLPSLQLLMNNFWWQKYINVLPYSIMAPIMDTLGDAMEDSTGWKEMAPYIAIFEHTIQQAIDVMQKQQDLIVEGNSRIGRILDWVLKYGPEKFSLTIQAAQDPEKMNKIVELVVSGNPLNIVQLDCNQTLKDWFYGKGALDSLPMADLERDICDENLANALYAEVLDVYDSNAYMAYIRNIFNPAAPVPTIDWVKMSKQLTDFPQISIDSSQRYATHFQQYDWQQWAKFINETIGLVMSQGSVTQLSGMVPDIMEQLEGMFENTTEWKIAKHIFNIIDVMSVQLVDQYADIAANGLTLNTLFENSTKIREYIINQNKLPPIIVDTVFNTLIDPMKLTTELFTRNLTGRVYCRDLFISQFVEFEIEADAKIVDEVFCGLTDFQGLLAELQTDRVSKAVTQAVEPLVIGLVFNNLTDIAVDYVAFANHTGEMVQGIISLQNFRGPIFPTLQASFNFTANNLKYKAALDNFLQQDISHWPQVLDQITSQLENKTMLNNIGLAVSNVWLDVAKQVHMQMLYNRVALQQLRAILNSARANNGSVGLHDLVLPGQLQNLLEALKYAPEMTDTLLYSLIELMNDPTKLATVQLTPELFDDMCTNLTTFQLLFTLPPSSSVQLSDMQRSMCALRINVTILIDELSQDIDGFSDILKYMNTQDALPLKDVFLGMFNVSTDYAMAMQDLFLYNYQNQSLTFNPPRWMNRPVWEAVLSKVQNYTINANQGLSQVDMYVAMMYGLAPVIDPYVNGGTGQLRALNTAKAIVDYITASLESYRATGYNDSVFLSGLDELSNIDQLYRQLPDFVESIVITSVVDQAKLQSFVTLLTQTAPGQSAGEIFCSLDQSQYQNYFVVPSGNKGDFTHIQKLICDVTYVDGLIQDLRMLTEDQLEFDNIIKSLNGSIAPSPFSTVAFLDSSRALSNEITQMVNFFSTFPNRAGKALEAEAWERAIQNIDQELRNMGTQGFNPNYIQAMLQSIDVNTLAPELIPYIHTAMAIANVTIRKLQPFNQSIVDILDFSKGYPETSKAMEVFNISTDVVHLLLLSGSSVKLAGLAQLPADQILPTLCAADWREYFSIGLDPTVDIDGVKAYVCSVNWTAVYHELITDLEVSLISSQLNNTDPVVWSEVFATVDAMTGLIQDIAAANVTFKYYPWMNETEWQSMIIRASYGMNNPLFQVQSSLGSLMAAAPSLEQLVNSNEAVKRGLYMANVYLMSSLDMMRNLQASNWDISGIFVNATETTKLLKVMEELPGFIDIALQTSLEPEKAAPLIKRLVLAGNNSALEFCSISDLQQYVVYDNKTNLSVLQDIVCNDLIDFNILLSELGSLNAGVYEAQNASTEYIMNQTVISDLIMTVSELITTTSTLNFTNSANAIPAWLQPSAWTPVFNRFAESLSKQGPFNMTRLMNLLQMIGIDEMFGSVNLPQLHVVNSILDVVIRKLELFNRTEVNITSILENSPETVKAMDILPYLADIAEVLMASSRTQKFSALYSISTPDEAIIAICTNSADTYFTVPTGSTVDLDEVVTLLCSKNWTAIGEELMADVNVKGIMAQINNTSPANFTLTMARVNRVNELIEYLIVNPPKFVIDPQWTWLNATVWEDILMRLNSNQQLALVDMISGYFFGVLRPMFGSNPEFNDFGLVLEGLLDSLKMELTLWNRPGENLTVAEILSSDSALNNYIVKALELSPDMYALFLSVSVRNAGDLQLLFSSPDPQALLCGENSTWLDYVVVPPQVNISQVEQFICSANFTVLADEVMKRFNINTIIADIQSNATANWDKIQTDLSEVISIITGLTQQAPNIIPPFDPNSFAQIAQDIMFNIDWSNVEIYLQMSDSMIRYMKSLPFWSNIEPYFQINQIVSSWIFDLISRLNLKPDLTLNLAELFPNATLLNEYVSATLNIDEKTSMKMLAGIAVRPDKISSLFMPTGDNSSAVIDLVCNSSTFTEFFLVPADADVTALSRALCDIISDGGADFVDQMKKSLKIDTLIMKINSVLQHTSTEVFSVRGSYMQQQELTAKIASFFNATSIMYDNINLNERFMRLTNETTWQSYVLALTENLPQFDLKLIGDALNGMMPLLRSMDWWLDAEKYFKMMNVLAEVGANRTAELPTVNVTLKTLIKDADNFRKLLSDSFAFTPDLFEGLVNAEFTLSPADLIAVNTTGDLQQIFCTARFPPTVNVTAVRNILCATNFQLILDEFLSELDLDIVIQEIGKIDVFSNVTSDFDWNDLLMNTNNLASNLGLFFTALRPPPVQEFFLYDGNMTAWFERLNKALVSANSLEANFKRVSLALQSLETSLAGTPIYRQMIITSQILQNYLDLAISKIDSLSMEVSLETILRNKTDLISLVEASFGAAPEIIELLLTQPMATNQLTALLTTPSADPCTMDLSVLFVNATPADIIKLQDVFCTVNITALFEEIKKEIETTYLMPAKDYDANATTFDWQGYMSRFTQLSQKISDMIQSPPTISPELIALINVTEYMNMFDRVQDFWLNQQFQLNANSFSALMQSLTPLLTSSQFGQQLSKFINVADIIISRVNGKLTDIKNNDVSLNTLLGDATELKKYLGNVIGMSPETVASLLLSQLGGEALVLLVTNRSSELCSLDADKIIILPEGGSADLEMIKSLFCDVNFTAFLNELTDEFNVSSIIQTLSSNTSAPVQWDRLFSNTQELASVITYLATNDPVIDQNLLEAFNMSRFSIVWQSLRDYDPANLLRLLDIYNPLVREAAGDSWPLIQLLITQYSAGVSNVQHILADMVSSGFTFESLLNNRTALLEFYSKISDSSTDLISETILGTARNAMNQLLQRDEIQAIVCNDTAVRTLVKNLPAYVDLTSVFCGVKDESWVAAIKARNYSVLEVQGLISAIDRWYFDAYIREEYSWEYINSHLADYYAEYANASLGDLEKPVKELISVLSNLGTIPPQYFPGFNFSYWMPLIDTLAISYTQNLPKQVLRTLELLEPLMRDTDFWVTLRGSVSAASQYMSWINDKLEEIDQLGENIDIVKLLPDLDEVEELLKLAVSPESAAEFLTAALQPAQLVEVLTSDPKAVFCDPAIFSKSFLFPTGTDVATLQTDLCEASRNDSFVLQKVWQMFDMQMLASELSLLTGTQQPTQQLTESPFRTMLKQFERLLSNAHVITRLMEAFNKNMPEVSSYFTMALTTVNTVLDPTANNVGGMCDALVSLIDEVPEFKVAEPFLVQMQTGNSIMAEIATAIDGLDDFLCELPSLNMSTLLNNALDSDLLTIVDKIVKINDAEYLTTTPFKCSAMIRDSMLPQQKIQNLIVDAMNGSFEVCIRKLQTENITLLSELSSYTGLMNGIRDLLNSEVLQSLKWLEPIRPLLDDVIASLLGQVQVTRLEAIVNQTAIIEVLNEIFSTNSSISTEEFLKSFYKVDELLSLLNRTMPEAEQLVCDSDYLKDMIQQDLVYVENVRHALCINRPALTRLLQGIADNLNDTMVELLASTRNIEDFINKLTDNIAAIMGEIAKLANLPDLLSMFVDLDVSSIRELLPLVQKALNSEVHLDVIVDSLIEIVDLLETRIISATNDTDLAVIFDDLRTLVRGVGSLDSLRRSVVVDIPLKSVLVDTSALETLLIKDVGLSSKDAQDVLNANFTTSMFAAVTALDIQSQLCDPEQIKYLLSLPKSSSLSYSEVSRALCAIDQETSLNISLAIVKSLDVSDLIVNFINQKFGINTAELQEVAIYLTPLQDELAVTTKEISKATEILTLPSTARLTGSAQIGAVSASSFSNIVCGSELSGYEAEQEAISDVDFGDINAAAIDASGVDDPDYFHGPVHNPINHCDDIRKTMFKQKGGKILWKYLKPLLVGKILFTPNTDMAKEIVRNANSSFDDLATILDTVKLFVKTQKALMGNQAETMQLQKLQPNPQKSLSSFKNADPALIRTLLNTDLNITALSEMLDLLLAPQNQMLMSSLSMAADYADCISLDRYVGIDSEADLEEEADRLYKKGEFVAGIVFTNVDQSRNKRSVDNLDLPKHIEYKIRMDIDNVESTMELQEMYYSAAPRDNILSDMRYLRGFIQIQEMVDRAIIKLHAGNNSITQTPAELQQMPATCYKSDTFMGYVYPYIVPLVMALSWLFSVAHCIKSLTAYRETGLEELMKVMGLKSGVIWTSWFTNTMLGMTLLSIISTIFIMVGEVLMLSDGIIVFLYLMTFSLSTTMFCYMVGSFFTKANVASAIGVMVFIISYFPYIIYTQFREDFTASAYHVSSLLSTTAFAIGATYISRWEQMGEGIQWHNIRKAPGYNEEAELSVHWMFIWMIIDSVIYFVIGWYVRNVMPGKFGYRLPLYFPFTKSYWGFGGDGARNSNSKYKHSNKEGLPVGISVNKLRKVYRNGKIAIDDLSLDFYEGQVTAFLGRNGAGKTTTINILTGMLSPTSGAAEIIGMNVNSAGIKNIRQNLGLCPQFDMLFDFMTVKEHLDLFASLKSSEPRDVIESDVEEMLKSMGLSNMRDELVGTLSGGMRRRVSVAMAFIGDSKVIILDEPTSSIDPHGRRVIWDVILKHRANRTIILCTHHLDEADTLGDRVAILDQGKLRAEGSPMSLKSQHASGYQLFLEKKPTTENADFDINTLTTLIKTNCPGAMLMTDIGSSITYTLPSADLPSFDQLFKQLSDKVDDLGLSGFGVSDSTLYEVFEKITESNAADVRALSAATSQDNLQEDFGESGRSSCLSMLGALFRKRFIHTFKDYKSYIALIILPILFVILALGVTTLVPDRSNQPNLELQPSLYPNTYSFFSLENERYNSRAHEFTSTLFNYPGVGTVCMDNSVKDKQFSCENIERDLSTRPAKPDSLPVCTCPSKSYFTCEGDNPVLDSHLTNTSDILLHVREDYDIQDYLLSTHPFYKTNRYGGWTFELSEDQKTTAKVWFDNRAFHSSPSYLNAFSNMILRAAVTANEGSAASSKYGITVFNHPLVLSQGQLSVKNALEKTADLGVSLTFLAAFSLIPAGLCVYLVMEHVKGEKHLQYVSGVGPIKYWFTAFFWDMMMFLLPVLVIIPLIYAFDVRSLSVDGNIGATICLFVTYAWAVLPFMYMTLKAFSNTTTAFFTLLMVNMFLGISLSTITFLLTFFQFVPNIKPVYLIMQKLFLIFPQYSFTSALMQMSVNQVRIDILSQFDAGIAQFYHPFNKRNGIYWNVISLVIQGLVFFIITLLVELKTTNCDDRISSKKKGEDDLDDDVIREKQRILQNSHQQRDTLIVKGLSKQYRLNNFRHILAVKDLTFGIQPGEVFGLCGVNGAGKTSTFKMLTGEILASEGFATLNGSNITSSSSRRLIGYCPQINSLDNLLTARQVLSVYAQLKGISNTNEVIKSIVKAFGMESYINKQVKAMSGGMKRNLCVAVSLMGNPDLVFLDEPTAGMDPVARRIAWNQILAAAARGCAIVLTSHSMAECEALCTRMAIMLNGKLACLGSSQHLKNKFGLGYTLKVKVSGPPPHTNKMVAFVQSKWPQAVVKDQHLNTTEFAIPYAGGHTLASLFSIIEKERHNLYIEEYSVFQTTLDQVFIQFARSQQDQVDDLSSSADSESASYSIRNPAYFGHADDSIVIADEKATGSTKSEREITRL